MSRDSDLRKTAAMVVTDKAAPTQHEHPMTDVTGLQAALDGKAPAHGHPYEPTGAIATHEAANDPHPMYLRQSEADALYDPLGAASAAQSAAASALAAHAAAADPHTGYQKESEKGQANGYAALGADGKVPTAQLPAGQSGAAWGGVTGTLSDQTDLQAALDAKAATGHNHDAAYAAVNHTQAISTVTGLQAALDGKQVAGSYEPANANIQAHVAASHAPADAQKNSDITKAEIEAKLTGEISTHTHPGGGSSGMVSVRMTGDVANATVNLANATGLSFAAQANSDYIIDANILWNTSGTAVGIKLSADFSSTGHTIAGQWIVNVANGTLDGAAFNADDVTVTTTAAPFTTSNHGKLWAILRTGANAGTFNVRFAAETTGTITIRTGSVLRYEKTL